MSEHTTGLFVWTELMTKDVAAARDFYAGLFGWTFKSENMGGMEYHMAHVGEKAVAGMMALQPGQGDQSYWINYVTVDDVDKQLTRTAERGGRKLVDPMEIPNIGRFAVISDPNGACIAPYRGTEAATPPETSPGAGDFCWHELMTNDPEAAKKFYPEIFGWELEKDESSGQTYWMFKAGGKPVAGIDKIREGAGFPPHWLSFVLVADVDAAAKKVTALGGRIFKEPTDIPNIGRFAVFADPTGGVLAMFQSAKKG
jgi:predicted enzyme related to lactoylglutathione lyase